MARLTSFRKLLAKCLLALLPTMAGCNHLFYYPDDIEYLTPASLGQKFEQIDVKSDSGNNLKLWLVPAERAQPIGTIIHFHGNGQNMSAHFLFVFWLTKLGYNIVSFDYSGYGMSSGEVDRETTILDGKSVVKWTQNHSNLGKDDIFILGQSLGGAIAVASLARGNSDHIKAVVLESTFSSYRGLARAKLGQSWLTWLFQYPLSLLISDEDSPVDEVAKLKMPMLVIHGDKDLIIPMEQVNDLFETATAPKEFVTIPHGGHTPSMIPKSGKWRRQIAKFLCDYNSQHQLCLNYLKEFKQIDDLESLVPKRERKNNGP